MEVMWLSWNIAPECISTVFLCIIWVYSRRGNLIPSMKNRMFQASLFTTFCAMTTNILSTVLIYWLREETLLLTWIITLVYFMATPLMGLVYFLYTIANIYEDAVDIKKYFIVAAIPGIIYLCLVLLTPFTKLLFNITIQDGYVQGPYIALTYVIFYLYCAACVILVAWRGKRVPSTITKILFSFPIIAAIVIIIQLIEPTILLSGSAATCAILIIYLYLQNKQISIDYLTQLPNRHEFLKMMELYVKKNHSFSVVVLSLREFKSVNDIHGQHSGDYLLAALSKYFCKQLGLREGEIYRYSGDEFAILLRDRKEQTIQTIIEKILNRMTQAWDVPGCTCILSAALGIVNYPKTAGEMEDLINGLEYAVVKAKTDGEHDNICYCTPELFKASKRRQIIAEELEANLKRNGFEIYFQPIFSVESKNFLKAEALLRMPSDRLERVFPDEFIPVAEETGLIIEITYLVLDKVCRFIRSMMEEGIELESVNVNFSALQFTQKDLLPRMLKIIEKHNVPYSKIKVELTESIVAENREVIKEYLCQLDNIGIRIGLDDFGTGYSNLISVLDMPIDTVKLDKSLVWSAIKNARCSIALKNFARAFRELEMTVLAEGVETEEQRLFVVEAGCTLIQGFFYAKPMPENEFAVFLREQGSRNL